jgi:L-seryl-tRNA(Ser) seleniumtransferase
LSAAAREAVRVAAGCTDVELHLASGKRGRRRAAALDALARAVPAAGAVHVVNNNAAALAWRRRRWPQAGRSSSAEAS